MLTLGTLVEELWERGAFMLTTPTAMMTAHQVIYERPPEGMARGRFAAPWWVIVLLTGAIVIATVAFLIVRMAVGARSAKERTGPPAP